MTFEELKKLYEKMRKCEQEQKNTARDLGKLLAEAEIPRPLMLDEVSASFVSWLRVQNWEDLGNEFGGYKIGRIFAYILDVICEKIEDSTAAPVKIAVPYRESEGQQCQ